MAKTTLIYESVDGIQPLNRTLKVYKKAVRNKVKVNKRRNLPSFLLHCIRPNNQATSIADDTNHVITDSSPNSVNDVIHCLWDPDEDLTE